VLALSEDSWVEGLAIYSPNTSNSDLYYMGIQWPGFLSPAPNLSFTASQPLPSASALSSALLSASSFGTTVLLASASGLALYEWNRTSSSLQFAGASSQVAMKVTAAAILVSGGSTYAVALTSSSSCAFALQTLLLQPSGSVCRLLCLNLILSRERERESSLSRDSPPQERGNVEHLLYSIPYYLRNSG
jgi:hypothetical protein